MKSMEENREDKKKIERVQKLTKACIIKQGLKIKVSTLMPIDIVSFYPISIDKNKINGSCRLLCRNAI